LQWLPYTPDETFDRPFAQTEYLPKEFTNVAKEATRKCSEKFILIKAQSEHAKLEQKTRYLRNGWKQYE
jgi:dynein heavy chain 1